MCLKMNLYEENNMREKIGITKIVGCLSGFLLICLLIGFIVVPHDLSDTQNYCFSDNTDLVLFEQKLEEENIPFSRLSDTSINISKDNAKIADEIFNNIFR